MIFGVLNPEKIWHQQLVHLPTSPIYCSHSVYCMSCLYWQALFLVVYLFCLIKV